jgi:hypothetical protein
MGSSGLIHISTSQRIRDAVQLLGRGQHPCASPQILQDLRNPKVRSTAPRRSAWFVLRPPGFHRIGEFAR